MQRTVSLSFLFLLFFEGIAGTAYQVLFLRQFSASIGSNAELTGIVIGVFLGAMSLGYRYGGKPTTSPLRKLGVNFLLMAAVGGCSASSLVSSAVLSDDWIQSPHIRLLIYSLFSVGVTAFLVSQSLPLLLQYKAWGENTSSQSGNALFVSTIGSMVGAAAPLPFVAPLIGASGTLMLLSIMCTIVGTLLVLNSERHWRSGILIFASMCGAVFPMATYLNATVNNTPFTSTVYNDIYLRTDGNVDIMEMNGARMSMRFKEGGTASSYLHYINNQINMLGVTNKNILVLGAGGFQLHTDEQHNRYTYVDIDQELIEWAGKYFGIDTTKVNLVANDARTFLLENTAKWDVIILDVFNSADNIPAHLVTQEFFTLIQDRLANEGVLIANMIASGGFRDTFSQRFHRTVHSVMPFCQIQQILPGKPKDLNNVIYTCFSHSGDEGLYRDDKRSPHSDLFKNH